MTTTCINGGGFAGLTTALLLAADGHDVTVVERDPAPPGRDPARAWDEWERRAVPQFRQTHAYLACARAILRAELPHVWNRLVEAGVREHNLAASAPLTVEDRRPRPRDEDLVYCLGRRATVEAVLRNAVDDDPRVEVLSEVAAKGVLVTDGPDGAVVRGLATSAGPVEAELTIDCGGRRSAMPEWLVDAGARRPTEQSSEYKIAYWTQWFRLEPGASFPPLLGPPAVEVGPIEVLRVPADNGWFSITIVATAEDTRFRVLSDQRRLLSFLAALPLTSAWVRPDVARPVGGIQPMFALVDQRRRFAVEGSPCARGVVGLGDAIAASNPSLARGTSFALLHAVALRDVLRDRAPRDAGVHFEAWADEHFEPWWQSTVAMDQAHLARMRAAARGDAPVVDPGWVFAHAAVHDADLWRLGLRIRMVLDLPQAVLASPGTMERVDAVIRRVGPPELDDLDVGALLAG